MILSIIIPVYNGQDKIARCLSSLLNQGLDPKGFEILVYDDGSSDNTADVVTSHCKKHPQIQLISHENRGPGACRNAGIDKAKGDYIYFIDADDYLMPHHLSHLVELINQLDLDLLTFKSKVIRKEDEITTALKHPSYSDEDLSVLDGRTYIARNSYKNEVWWFLISREYLIKHGFRLTEGRFMEDVLFTTKAVFHADRIAHVPKMVHRYVKSAQSTLGNEEPAHYVKVISDMEYLIINFEEIIKDAEQDFTDRDVCLERLKIRRDSLVFFMIVRMLKSHLSFKEIWKILERVRKTSAYPMQHFISEEYNKTIYKILTPLFNRKSSLYLLFKLVRSSNKLRGKL